MLFEDVGPSQDPGTAQPQLRNDADCTKEVAQPLDGQVEVNPSGWERGSAAGAARSQGFAVDHLSGLAKTPVRNFHSITFEG